MKALRRSALVAMVLVASRGWAEESTPIPPRADVRPHELAAHGDVRTDNYFWLRERDDPQVLDYLRAENDYYQAMTAGARQLEQRLFEEIKARDKQTDVSVPIRRGDYVYYTRTEDGKQYAIHCRRRADDEQADEEILLDVNELAAGRPFTRLFGTHVSPDQNLLAYAVDTVGRFVPEIRFRDLTIGKDLPDRLANGGWGKVAWADDNRTVFYVKKDLQTLRAYQVYRHRLGSDPETDELVYEEDDDTFGVAVWRTRSEKYIVVASRQTLTTEYRFLDVDAPDGEFRLFLPRARGHEYHVHHGGDRFYIRSNDGAENFRLFSTPADDTRREAWREEVAPRDDVLLADVLAFRNFLVLLERENGLPRIRVRSLVEPDDHYLAFEEPAYAIELAESPNPAATLNPRAETSVLRFRYTSLTTPSSIYDYDMTSREKQLRKRQEVLGDFDPKHYQTKRLFAPARDGEQIPISLVYRKDRWQPAQNPLLLYGYGSYGATIDAEFRPETLSLLDRGFVFAIAHIRGGQLNGRRWYEEGKLLKKKNTFRDFIDAADFLAAESYADPERMYAMGGSAGGLLMGAVMNMRPDRFHGVVAKVPFVDALTTMLDASLPLTTSEYDEWGDPNQQTFYEYIRSYSPYDNIVVQEYPHLLVTAGLHDSQVQYWEAAKWVAKLRALKTGNHRLLLKTHMEAGHGGPSGRDRSYREAAAWQAFLLDLAGKSAAAAGG
ncbi:MAG: S9 family peptidase [Planctomycetota bacterium]